MILARKVTVRVRRFVKRLLRLVRSIHLKAGIKSLGFGVPSRRSISSVISTKSWSSCSSALFIPLRPMNRLPMFNLACTIRMRSSQSRSRGEDGILSFENLHCGFRRGRHYDQLLPRVQRH